jgi:prophage regulatory protein
MTTLRLMRLPEVLTATGLGRDSVYRLIREGRFPAQRRLSERASAWRADEVTAWIESRPVANPEKRAGPSRERGGKR